MINIDPYIVRAEVGFALMVVAFVVVWRWFVKIEPERKRR
jgi:hypothetical protein